MANLESMAWLMISLERAVAWFTISDALALASLSIAIPLALAWRLSADTWQADPKGGMTYGKPRIHPQ